LIFDTTNIPSGNAATGIHWPTAQATSLQNCVFKLSQASGTKHVGVFIENGQPYSPICIAIANKSTGSGGFLTDLVFTGGSPAMSIGSQQFTTRNLTFHK
jgi:glucan 1,3-beta-glucosidase